MSVTTSLIQLDAIGRGNRPFRKLTGIAAPWMEPNIDTDIIIRVERCARTPKEEMGRYAFELLRYMPDGTDSPEFILNKEPWRRAKILVAGENFGCGSSREMAVWAVSGMGFQCIVAPSYGEIFYNNCFENGLLPIRLAPAEVERLGTQLLANPSGSEVTIDLEAQLLIAAWGDSFSFEIDPLRKRTLLEGLDAVALTLSREAVISAWQRADRERRPWIYRQ